jgi:hypothetical protein
MSGHDDPPLKKIKTKPLSLTSYQSKERENITEPSSEEKINRAIRNGESCVYNVKFALYKDTQFGNYLVPFVGSNLNMTPKEWADSKWVLDPPDTGYKWLWEGATSEELHEFEEFCRDIRVRSDA